MENRKFAGLKPRLMAFLLDYLIILIYISALVIFALVITPMQTLFSNPVQSDIVAFSILVLPVLLYFALQEGGRQQATWGKKRMRLEVINIQGNRLDLKLALIRAVIKFLPWQIAHTAIFQSTQAGELPQPIVWTLYILAYGLIIIYVVTIWKHPRHRTIYDWVAGSAVVHDRE